MTFVIGTRPSDSPLVKNVWRARSVEAGSFFSVASLHWEMVVTWHHDRTLFTVRGPQTRATELAYSVDLEWLGITFEFGTLMPSLPPARLMNGRDVNLAEATRGSFWLDGSIWELPTFDNADGFVRRLQAEGLLVYDPVVQSAHRDGMRLRSIRTTQDHFARTTGLTQSMVRQIQRAHAAAELLKHGVPAVDTAHEHAYYDQPHLTRSLKRFLGRTPAQIAREQAASRSSDFQAHTK